MTDAIDSWLTPLLFISAPALMILSMHFDELESD